MRKLAAAALSFSAAIFLANYILPFGWLLSCGAILLVLGLLLLYRRRRWLEILILVCFGLAAGLGCFWLHAMHSAVPARELNGQTRRVEARLLDYPLAAQGYCRANVRITGPELPKLEAVLYDNSMKLASAVPGQRLAFDAKLSSADTRYGEKYDYYNSRNIYLTLSARSDIEIVDDRFDWTRIPIYLNHAVIKLIEASFPKDTKAFMKSLMLGQKNELYTDTDLYASLSRAGMMHALAVSGLHIAFLIGLVQLLMGNNRRSAWICILLVWLFVMMTGASPSSIRAGVMQSLLLLAPILRRENDPITSLSAALALILLVNPFACASVSLQLSFAAMAGILCFGKSLNRMLRIPARRKLTKKLSGYLSATAASSLAVMPFSIPLMVLHFGYVSVLSPLSNLLCMWAVSLCFRGGYAACVLTMVYEPLGKGIGWLISWLVRYIEAVCGIISAVPFCAIYVQSAFAIGWILISYGLFFYMGLRFRSRWERMALPALLSGVALFLCLNLTEAYYNRDAYVCVHDVGQGECISVFAQQRVLMIDCGGQGSLDNAGETAAAYLSARGKRQVDALILTHMDTDHVNGVPTLMARIRVDNLILPAGADDENGWLSQIEEAAERQGTHVIRLDEDSDLTFGRIGARLYTASVHGSSNDEGLMACVSIGDFDMLVMGDASIKREEELLAQYPMEDLDLLVVGHHGSANSSSEKLLRGIGASEAVISVGYNSYGHPAQETLERLTDCGYNIHRTDLDGRYEMRIGDYDGEETR